MEDESTVEIANAFFRRFPQTQRAEYLIKMLEGKSAQFNITDGKPFALEVRTREIHVFKGSLQEPFWIFGAARGTYLAIFRGQIPLSMAVAAGKLTFSRSVKHEFAGYALLGAVITMCQEELRKAVVA